MSARPTRPARIAVFTHDTYGMGHVQRSLRILGALSERAPDAALLLVTGSPALHRFKNRPPNCDFVKIPTIVKTGSASTRPPYLPIAIAEMTLLRERIIRETLLSFDPDVLLVDNFPLGSSRELMSVLHDLRPRHTRTVLGLRDIVDSPEVVRADWERMGIPEVLDRSYDRILVYGMREVLDVVDAFGLAPRVAHKVHYCGYVTVEPAPLRPAAELCKEYGIVGEFLLATGGGGGDSLPLLSTFVEALEGLDYESAVLVTGPLMSSSDRAELERLAAHRHDVVLIEHTKEMPSFLDAAQAVVTMCGYNMAGEILAFRPRAIVTPRTWRYGEHKDGKEMKIEWEQLLRARALAEMGVAELIEPEDLSPAELRRRLVEVLASPRQRPGGEGIELDGRGRAAEFLLSVAAEAQAADGARGA